MTSTAAQSRWLTAMAAAAALCLLLCTSATASAARTLRSGGAGHGIPAAPSQQPHDTVSAVPGLTPVTDDPYVEVAAYRLTDAASTAVSAWDWDTLPFTGATQLIGASVPALSAGVVAVDADGALWFASYSPSTAIADAGVTGSTGQRAYPALAAQRAGNESPGGLFASPPLGAFTRVNCSGFGPIVTEDGARVAALGLPQVASGVTVPAPPAHHEASSIVQGLPAGLGIVVTPTSVHVVSCAATSPSAPEAGAASGVGCNALASTTSAFGFVNDTTVLYSSGADTAVVWVAASTGLWRVECDGCAHAHTQWHSASHRSTNAAALRLTAVVVDPTPSNAVAASVAAQQIAAGSNERLGLWSDPLFATQAATTEAVVASGPVETRWEWVSFGPTQAGGPIDAPITSLEYDDAAAPGPRLYIGTFEAVNVREANGTIWRAGGARGLPFGNITRIAVQPRHNVPSAPTFAQSTGPDGGIVWLSTPGGLIRGDLGGGPLTDVGAPWRLFFGPRYLPPSKFSAAVDVVVADNATVAVATDVASVAIQSPFGEGPTTTGGGIAVLASQYWTLEEKAAHYETYLPVLDRHGLLAECHLTAFGSVATCTKGSYPSDNTGSWTSIVTAGEAYRYAVTGSAEAAAAVTRHFDALVMLNNITDIKGMVARTAIGPEAMHQHPADGIWYNSTAPGYTDGWMWKADTSSDEITQHLFVYPVVATVASGAVPRGVPVGLVDAVVSRITADGFYLIDKSGKPTKWGRWAPHVLNHNRSWSDERGVNAVEMLGYLCAAYNLTGDPSGTFARAYAELTNATNQYDQNVLNAKMTWPADTNYGDDDLGLRAWATHLTMCGTSANATQRAPLVQGLSKEWQWVRWVRSNVFNSLYFTIAAAAHASRTRDVFDVQQSDLDDGMVWNLRSWPLECINWPVINSHRIDVRRAAMVQGGDGQLGRDRDHSFGVLPINERGQLRWDVDNPHQLDGGHSGYDGNQWYEPGSFLQPYWAGRWLKVITAPAHGSS